MNKQLKALLLVLPLLIIAGLIMADRFRGSFQPLLGEGAQQVQIGRTVVDVMVADEPLKWMQGLSGHPGLGPKEGMIFMFPQKQVRSFWMKDMNFPLDIIWIDGDTILHIHEDLPPEGESPLRRYSSEFPVNVVLEVNAGFCREFKIKVGDKVMYAL